MTKRVGIIGFGAIGRTVTQAWLDAPVAGHEIASLLARSHQVDEARALLGDAIRITADFDEFLANDLDVVVELAGQPAVRDLGTKVLRAGVDLMVLSVGSLASQAVFDELLAAAAERSVRVLVPVGAIAGLDGLLALRRAGLRQVVYTSVKPPQSWKGTAAEQALDLDNIKAPTIFFEGSAREAALKYPKNANLAAAVALAGLGLDQTSVVLIADPGTKENIGRIEAEGAGSRLQVTVAGRSEPSNPKSSQITGVSVLSALENDAQLIAFA
ncbi:MAG: aspartate dehydrogenase [Hydrogenophaga sp.]|uniref:aspartate dehydrogenase n=1 Tax=Hydrogenophaga sp. TaxID=1904254 RepID=UPI002609159E|nr:aspartate dehydrogenase [Hydrogenophaga sp.]MCV0437457.1 aspartate dehydrogenase [Hydrogenophaga sp.]